MNYMFYIAKMSKNLKNELIELKETLTAYPKEQKIFYSR